MISKTIRWIILDRDGVINKDSSVYIKSPEEWIPIPGSLAAIAALNRLGYHIVVVTNQSGLARGYYTLATLTKIHQKMQDQLAALGGHIEAIYFCPHHPDDDCQCRKPKPGLLLQMSQDFNVDLRNEALFIGDKLSDIQVAQAVNCPAILVKTGVGEQTWQQNPSILNQTPAYANLAEFVNSLVTAGCD